jgi:hypothetical protein
MMIRRVALEQLNHYASDRPDVTRRRCSALIDDFGRHPVGRPCDDIPADDPTLRGHTEIGQLNRSVFVGQDIGAFDVAMNDALLMKELKSFKHLVDVY